MTPRDFDESLWQGVLCQFAIESVRTGEQVGLVRADRANLFHGYAFLSVTFLPEYRMRGWPVEGVALFASFLFTKFNLQNIYSEAAEVHLGQYKSGLGRYFEIEACFKGRLVLNGVRQNQYVLTHRRETSVPLLDPATEERTALLW
jgi:hypothetical protein